MRGSDEHRDVWISAGTMGTMSVLLLTPQAVLLGLAAALGVAARSVDALVARRLDQFLAREARLLKTSVGDDLLDFRTSFAVPGLRAGVGWRRVKVVRTIAARLEDGYRVKIRAYGEGAHRRVIVRSAEVELRRAAAGRRRAA